MISQFTLLRKFKNNHVFDPITIPEFVVDSEEFFEVKVRLNDGILYNTFLFDNKKDALYFYGNLARIERDIKFNIDPYIWSLPIENNISINDDMLPYLSYEFAVTTYLTTTGSNTYQTPFNWNNFDNLISVIGGGGSGGSKVFGSGGGGSVMGGSGGGGGGFSSKSNLTMSGSVNYTIGAGGNSVSGANGYAGGNTFFNGANLASCSVGASGGAKGIYGSTTINGGAGGASSSGTGNIKYSGGRGGNISGGSLNYIGTGGGGAAGPSGIGANGGDVTSGSNKTIGTVGGQGGNSAGGAGGSNTGGPGSSGTEWTSYGSGGGGGGKYNADSSGSSIGGGDGGHYGAGGGGIYFNQDTGNPNGSNTYSGAGANGIIRIMYTPLFDGGFNIPMLGM